MYLENINGPEDVKKLDADRAVLAQEEIRDSLLVMESKHGGHLQPPNVLRYRQGRLSRSLPCSIFAVDTYRLRCLAPDVSPQDAHRPQTSYMNP